MTSRSRFLEKSNYVVTNEDVKTRLLQIVQEANWLVHGHAVTDPLILPDRERGGYGLFATRDYRAGEVVTEYGGTTSSALQKGDYVGYLGDGVCIDGHHGFRLCQRGRWINEYNGERSMVNVTIGRQVRTTRPVKCGEQFFGDYGPEYQRNY